MTKKMKYKFHFSPSPEFTNESVEVEYASVSDMLAGVKSICMFFKFVEKKVTVFEGCTPIYCLYTSVNSEWVMCDSTNTASNIADSYCEAVALN